MNTFELVVIASLRVRQLVDGCTPRVGIEGKKTTIARREVLTGKVAKIEATRANDAATSPAVSPSAS
jgi:DNA-directed RNA polymerase subunit K/omega